MDGSNVRERHSRTAAAERAGKALRWAGNLNSTVVLAAILLIGAGLRLIGIDWDQSQHLHPDERFITMIVAALKWPRDFAEYFDTARNPLSPYNFDFAFFVYGTLPLYIVKWAGNMLNMASYDQVYYVGRALSALADLGSVVMIFLIGRRLYDEKVALAGAALLSFSVLNIQQSHFFTVDTFASFFVVLGFFFAVRASDNGHWWEYALAGASLGAGVACKVTAYLLGIVIVLAALVHFYRAFRKRGGTVYDLLEHAIVRVALAAIVSLLFFRALQPISFHGPGFLDFGLNTRWLANMQEIGELTSGAREIPYNNQWAVRAPLMFPLENMVLWGMGLPMGLAAWAGWALAGYELVRWRRVTHLLPVVFVVVIFVSQGTQFVKYMRYLLAIYPFLALLAGYLLVSLWRRSAGGRARPAFRWRFPISPRAGAGAVSTIVIGGTLLYALAFVTIYMRPHSRIQASEWIYANVPLGSSILNEHWDDSLPLRVGGRDGFATMYRGLEMPNYNDDNPEKLATMVDYLKKADYLVLSSNRLYGSIPRIPLRWPMTTRYYNMLLAGQLGFARVAEFTSYPQILGVSIPDQSAEEAFTVYDHPKVTIFKKSDNFDAEAVRRQLSDGIDWNSVIRLRADQAASASTGLNLAAADRLAYAAAGTWSRLYDRLGLANQLPVLAWAIALILLGLAALPLAYVALGGLADRGYAFARALGLLLVGWAVWMLGSAHALEFGPVSALAALAVLALASSLVLGTRGREMLAFYRSRWRLLAVDEVIFWLAFGFFLIVRAGNPDLWHPVMGGEKPMDFAYFNAVLKSPFFPPYDPWFAGGYINYYYFGWVLAGVLVKLTGVIPQVAYNLDVPTFYAFTAVGAFGVAYSLAEGWLAEAYGRHLPRLTRDRGPWLAGFAGLMLTAVLGNLGEARLINDGFKALSKI
ncbi:MAG: DUF2298 domain-containing protein, partial [Chloroflexota bacterium]